MLLRNLILIACIFTLHTHAKDTKTAVIVIGAPRSGTSCVSGVLDILGIDFGDNLCGPNPFNEKGGFEDKAFKALTHRILDSLNMKVYAPRIVHWHNEPKKEEFKNNIKAEIAKFNNKSFGIKCPAISLILPLFQEALSELGYETKVVIVLRNPDEIAASWFSRWKRTKEVSFGAISKIYFNIIRYARDNTHVIYFDNVIKNTKAEVVALNNFLPGTKNYDQAKKELENFIDQELKHENARRYLELIHSLVYVDRGRLGAEIPQSKLLEYR